MGWVGLGIGGCGVFDQAEEWDVGAFCFCSCAHSVILLLCLGAFGKKRGGGFDLFGFFGGGGGGIGGETAILLLECAILPVSCTRKIARCFNRSKEENLRRPLLSAPPPIAQSPGYSAP